ncbi:hypothetical protein HK100_004305 [Physocladia obscura]|uniref:Uncharacterized protein n=1 Tax=Physocladia obscura TaxID=109957 RepID=A0AAD5SV80_9FUNG|nr:hypothetical protein HK100_004305 [Physocladia obscura]
MLSTFSSLFSYSVTTTGNTTNARAENNSGARVEKCSSTRAEKNSNAQAQISNTKHEERVAFELHWSHIIHHYTLHTILDDPENVMIEFKRSPETLVTATNILFHLDQMLKFLCQDRSELCLEYIVDRRVFFNLAIIAEIDAPLHMRSTVHAMWGVLGRPLLIFINSLHSVVMEFNNSSTETL